MHFSHSPAIWRDFPELAAGVLVLDLATAPGPDPPLAGWYDRARQRLAVAQEGEMPEIAAWRRAFSKMGLKPTQYRCAAESLLRRFRKENDLPRFHPVVDLCNAISLTFAIPIAVFDLANVDTFLEVRYATGDERYLAFNDENETPEKREVVFCDAAGNAHSRRWTFRQSKKSVMAAGTNRALVVAEALHTTARKDVQALVDEVAQTISGEWGTPTHRAVLSEQTPRLEF